MALLRDFELPGTGYVIPNAYHVVVNVTTEKRLNDIMPPPDESQPNGYTVRDDDDESQWIYWKSGYIGKIAIEIYDSKESRDSGKKPLGALGFSPTSVTTDCQVSNPGKDFKIEFFIDTNSPDSVLTQAYNHLKGTEYYKNALKA